MGKSPERTAIRVHDVHLRNMPPLADERDLIPTRRPGGGEIIERPIAGQPAKVASVDVHDHDLIVDRGARRGVLPLKGYALAVRRPGGAVVVIGRLGKRPLLAPLAFMTQMSGLAESGMPSRE